MAETNTKTRQGERRRFTAVDRERAVFALRVAGWTFDEIARHEVNGQPLYASRSAAFDAYGRHLAKLGAPANAEEVRRLEVARLDAMVKALWPFAVPSGRRRRRPDMEAISQLLRIHFARVRLLALDKPATEELDPDELRRLAEENNLDPGELIQTAERILQEQRRWR